MKNGIKHIASISDINRLMGFETQHPLVAVVDFSNMNNTIEESLISTGFYSVMLKGSICGSITYGRNQYDYQEDTMVFFGPNQIIGLSTDTPQQESKGLGLFFHPDLLRGTTLSSKIASYNFFSYEVSEALHLSAEEKRTVQDCLSKITTEITRPVDKHSRLIIVHTIELLLGYCQRFYDRQFITRENLNHDLLSKFESILSSYFETAEAERNGLPTVKYFADKLNLSSSYFSDLIKKETGKSAQDHIQLLIFERAKVELATSTNSISQIAYSLGFEYPQYFSRQFKKRTGMTPNEFRAMS